MTLSRKPAVDLLADLKSGALSAEALMAATLDRIEVVNGEVNAIVALRTRDDLMAEARAKDADRDMGGPLHGLPIAVKDLVNVKGIVSSHGSPLFADHVPEKDDLLAARLRAAGAILIGKTNVPEFGLGSHTFNTVYGTTKNPYNTAHSAGGSSGGAAVALAAGMTALADGSDMMGSLRNPAAWNNVYGFRPSWGLVPSESIGDTFLHQLATLGPMGRSPADIAILLDVISGADPLQPHAYDSPPFAPLSSMEPKGLKIGWLGDWGGAMPMEAGILDNAEAALSVLCDLGCDVETVSPPFDAEAMFDSWQTLRSWAVGAGIANLMEKKAQLKETALWELERGLKMTAMEVHNASVIRSDWFRAAAALFETYDALVLPSAQVWPFEGDYEFPKEIAGIAMDTYHRWMQVTIPIGLLGLPALAIPAGFGPHGLPMGVQVFGPRRSDAKLLALGEAYHRATDWPGKRPAM
ncbi:MAG: amidase [Arenibacterium sp.]